MIVVHVIFSQEFPFEYGHEYRPALATIFVCQQLRRHDIDRALLDELVVISLRDVLAPSLTRERIEVKGIDDISLDEQWKFRFPIHIIHRYLEIEINELATRSNFVDQALALLKLLEQTLEFSSAYYCYLEFGPNWRDQFTRSNSHLTYGDLRNMLNTSAFEDVLWTEAVIDLLDQPLLEFDDVIDIRNALSHDRRSRLSNDEYEDVKARVLEIFIQLSIEQPVFGEVRDRHTFGDYEFQIHWENMPKWCHLQTDADLDSSLLYYLPPEAVDENGWVQLDAHEIVPCRSNRVINNINEYLSE